MNIMLTSYCNRHCPYCFAQAKLTQPGQDYKNSCLSLENLRVVMDFLKRSKVAHVGLIGGEPTLHPQFTKIVDTLLREKFNLKIFSNAVFSAEVAEFLHQRLKQPWAMLVNINAPETYTREEWKKVIRALRLLKQKVSLGFNASRVAFNAGFLPPLVNKYKISRLIRLGIANPIVGIENEHIPLQSHARMSAGIVRFVEACAKQNVWVSFDCGFTLCSFSDRQLGRLVRSGCRFGFHCAETIDVNCDLSLWRCFPTARLVNRRLTDFKDMRGIIDYYARKFTAFRRVGLMPKCRSCVYRRRRQCGGGCLAHIIRTFAVAA
ncbi:MAG: radical SAM protein [Candidatus Omnitrophota bacterium]|nr:radical SAM protein [Candidatus Omnitrophota bacterium]